MLEVYWWHRRLIYYKTASCIRTGSIPSQSWNAPLMLGSLLTSASWTPGDTGNAWRYCALSHRVRGRETEGVLLAPSVWRPGMLLNISQHTGQAHPQNYPSPNVNSDKADGGYIYKLFKSSYLWNPQDFIIVFFSVHKVTVNAFYANTSHLHWFFLCANNS